MTVRAAAQRRTHVVLDRAGDGRARVAVEDHGPGVATVDLSDAFADAEGRRQLLAVAQLVCTLTDRPGVGQVAFTLGGEPVEVPRGDGTTTSDPVARDDYRGLLP